MEDWSHLRRCIDVRRSDVEKAVRTHDGCAELLAHLSTISRPMSGAPLTLLLFARMATTECTWLEGGLHVDAVAAGTDTTFDVLQDLGVGYLERILPRFVMHAPLAEFASALRRVPGMVKPLVVTSSDGRLTLTATEAARRTSDPGLSITELETSALLMPPTPGFAFAPPGLGAAAKKKP